MAISAIFTAIGGVVSAVGALASASAQAQTAKYNAAISERNKVIADQNRKSNLELVSQEAEDKRRENVRTMATIRSAYGSSGLDMAGTPLDVLEDTAQEMSIDVQRTEYQGYVQNREGAAKMAGYEEQANLSRMEAKNAKTAGYLNAFGYLAGAGSSLAKQGAFA